eukprot:GHVS01082968.1.p1 GENE.GHVS01082968.1~~GHVS01082968.1.p1  ORF type:complete len:1145 (+),score=286.16 GHVS01082968.1:153-3587(+)
MQEEKHPKTTSSSGITITTTTTGADGTITSSSPRFTTSTSHDYFADMTPTTSSFQYNTNNRTPSSSPCGYMPPSSKSPPPSSPPFSHSPPPPVNKQHNLLNIPTVPSSPTRRIDERPSPPISPDIPLTLPNLSLPNLNTTSRTASRPTSRNSVPSSLLSPSTPSASHNLPHSLPSSSLPSPPSVDSSPPTVPIDEPFSLPPFPPPTIASHLAKKSPPPPRAPPHDIHRHQFMCSPPSTNYSNCSIDAHPPQPPPPPTSTTTFPVCPPAPPTTTTTFPVCQPARPLVPLLNLSSSNSLHTSLISHQHGAQTTRHNRGTTLMYSPRHEPSQFVPRHTPPPAVPPPFPIAQQQAFFSALQPPAVPSTLPTTAHPTAWLPLAPDLLFRTSDLLPPTHVPSQSTPLPSPYSSSTPMPANLLPSRLKISLQSLYTRHMYRHHHFAPPATSSSLVCATTSDNNPQSPPPHLPLPPLIHHRPIPAGNLCCVGSTYETPADPSLRILGSGAYGRVVRIRRTTYHHLQPHQVNKNSDIQQLQQSHQPSRRQTDNFHHLTVPPTDAGGGLLAFSDYLAMKVMDKQHFCCRGLSEQLDREVWCHTACRHPHIVRVESVLQTQRHVFVLMELMDAGPVSAVSVHALVTLLSNREGTKGVEVGHTTVSTDGGSTGGRRNTNNGGLRSIKEVNREFYHPHSPPPSHIYFMNQTNLRQSQNVPQQSPRRCSPPPSVGPSLLRQSTCLPMSSPLLLHSSSSTTLFPAPPSFFPTPLHMAPPPPPPGLNPFTFRYQIPEVYVKLIVRQLILAIDYLHNHNHHHPLSLFGPNSADLSDTTASVATTASGGGGRGLSGSSSDTSGSSNTGVGGGHVGNSALQLTSVNSIPPYNTHNNITPYPNYPCAPITPYQQQTATEAAAACCIKQHRSGPMLPSGILHRDIKPDNILLNSMGVVKLSDFGWCTLEKAEASHTMAGTFTYMPPEVLDGEGYAERRRKKTWGLLEAIDGGGGGRGAAMRRHRSSDGVDSSRVSDGGSVQTGRVDTWSIGCCMYEFLSGQPLFSTNNPPPGANFNAWSIGEMKSYLNEAYIHKCVDMLTSGQLWGGGTCSHQFVPQGVGGRGRASRWCFGTTAAAGDFLKGLLSVDVDMRFTAKQALSHYWLSS